jgi:alpha-methylacyl-CoA racemase
VSDSVAAAGGPSTSSPSTGSPAAGGPAAGGPLAGIRVIDLSRLAPGPYGSMLLADLGAEVIAVTGGRAGQVPADYARGKRFVHLNLKQPASREALRRLVATADVLIEGFRPGVADRLGAGYAELSQVNPRLVYCSVTGYDPAGPAAQAAGHDINYLAVTGLLGAMGPAGGPPALPLNVVADLAGGGLLAAFGICAALVERDRSGRGQQITATMTDGVLSMMETWLNAWRTPLLPERGLGFTTGAAPFYRCYRCADGQYVAVGAVEDGFFAALWDGLGLPAPYPADRFEPASWPGLSQVIGDRFATASRDEWTATFAGVDACVTPVLTPGEVLSASGPPPPVPRFSRTPGERGRDGAAPDATAEVLARAGLSDGELQAVAEDARRDGAFGLKWPPD